MMMRVLSLVMFGALITSCGNNKQELIKQACAEVDSAWGIRNFYTPKYQALRMQHWTSAANIFREISSQDSGFAKYAARANEAANNSVTNYTEFYEMINFCGLN
jgi:outer membrane protein assembly factor BamD (BamD/ComL family)